MEALTMVGGAALAPLFDSLLADLRSGDVLNYGSKNRVLKELRKWEETLKTIKAVLHKAEEQQRTDASVKIWFDDLQNLAYDVEDILDDFNTKAKLESKAGTSKVKKMIRSSIDMFTFVSTAEIKDISERLERIKGRMELLKLSANESKIQVKEAGTSSVTSSEVNEADLYGRDDDRKRILDQLKNESGDGRMLVIPIVGMGGLGKTTLAQLVYNDTSLQFDFKAWVTVGETFDVLTITKAILRQFGGDLPQDFSSLQVKLKEKLSGKKALVVLDDVWITNEEYENWTRFSTPFKATTSGSRIIVTTRNRSVANITSTTDGYDLQGLSNDNCLSILANHALERKDFSEHSHLEELGGQIAKKCDGLPLAAKALGGALRGKQDTSSWKGVLNSKIWEEGKNVFQALQLSYCHLPSYLKRCFGYTAIFPKDYEFDKTWLVTLWMAEGFVEQMEKGYKYFDELLSRSFFQKSSSDESLYVMHDLINDLARSVSGHFSSNLDEEEEELCAKVRYSAFTCHHYDFPPRFKRLHEMKHLRTLLGLRSREQIRWDPYLSAPVLDVVVKKLRWLRVLALLYAITELPASIDCLKYLRYLDLSYAHIKILPESLCKLFNLKALILFGCKHLCELPKDFCYLINLQFLDIRGTDHLKEMPLSIGDLKDLHILGKFVVGRSDAAGMLKLLKIPNLKGRQDISALQNVQNATDAEAWSMIQLEGIDRLKLEWTNKLDDSRDEKNEEEVLNALKPQKNITELSIKFYGGRKMPSWIGDPLFGKIKILNLQNCFKVASLPALGQLPSLEELTLNGMDEIKELGMTFYGNVPSSADVFRSLKILRIENLEELYEWSNYSIDEGKGHAFSKLKNLKVTNCPKLELCSLSLPNVDQLEVVGCKELVLRSLCNLQSLTKLRIERIAGLESVNKIFSEASVSLQEMIVMGCDELVSLVEDEGNFPLNLQYLGVFSCYKLEKLPNQLHSLTSLTYLSVAGCPKLETFPTGGLPQSVKRVHVWDCNSLVNLPEGILVDNYDNSNISHIEELSIWECKALNLPSNLGFPTSLWSLDICSSSVETQLLRSLQLQNGFSRLTYLTINSYQNLELFPDTTPPIPTLLNLRLYGCKKLRSLPNHMNQFTSLQVLVMDDCPQLASIPEGGLPTNLKQLSILNCDKLERKVLLEQSLNALTCLEKLEIRVRGGMEDVYSFPHDSLLLPTSLTRLKIVGLRKLKSISCGIQRLASLQELFISECPKLQSLPRVGLPPSLGCLQIKECPILGKRCRKGKGDLWHLVSSIPKLQMRP